jgi:hypothetical protein
MERVTLSQIVAESNHIDYNFDVSAGLKKYFEKSNHLFLDYNVNIEKVPNSILAIPFVANVIPLIWLTNSTLIVHELDRSFYHCLPRIKAAYQQMFPNCRLGGSIQVTYIVENQYEPAYEAASFFSGGLDAVTTFIRHIEEKPVLITEYGWHKHKITDNEVWSADKQNAIEFANTYGLNNMLVQSNYGTMFNTGNINYEFAKRMGDNWWHGLHHSLAIISSAIPAAYQLKIGRLYIASSKHAGIKGHVTCASYPTVDNEIRFASGKVVHDAFHLARQDKIRVVTDYFSKSNQTVPLRVCFLSKENCCYCEKCLRTIIGIVAEGHDPVNYGFYNISRTILDQVKSYLDDQIKFFTDSSLDHYWERLQERLLANEPNIKEKEFIRWFASYDLRSERKKALLKYRVTKFFPILKRKIKTQFNHYKELYNGR